ncbi:MAG: 2-oxoacid:acceptor oxidoreductase family protein [Nanoarchaeota archaeon]
MIKLAIIGTGGQGIRLMGNILAECIMSKSFEVSAMYDYDAAMRGGGIQGYIIFSKTKIINPIIETADILLMLDKPKSKINAKRVIMDESVDVPLAAEKMPFSKISEQMFSKKTMLNMVALGFILKILGIGLDEKLISGILPEKFLDENLAAIKAGYGLNKAESTDKNK